jgi:hypothetical protein
MSKQAANPIVAVIALCMVLAACGDEEAPGPAPASPAAVPNERGGRLPDPPARPAIDSDRLPNDIYRAVCHIGHPALVQTGAEDGDARSIYFPGPFRKGDDPEVWDYLHMAIDGPERRWVTRVLPLARDQIQITSPKPGELDRYRLPRIQGVEPNINLVRLQVGDPTLVRDVEAGRQRYIFEQKICRGEQLLEGIYLDVEQAQVVKARGIEHPMELRWVLSGGRSPGPDPLPTHYLDVPPAIGSPQSVALAFIRRRNAQDPESARRLVWEDELLRANLHEVLSPARPGSRIEDLELTYQTTSYGHDETRITVRYEVYSDTETRFPVEDRLVLRKRNDDWLVVDSYR